MFCEVIYEPINFHIIKDSGCAPSSPLKRGPVCCCGMKDFHAKPNLELKISYP